MATAEAQRRPQFQLCVTLSDDDVSDWAVRVNTIPPIQQNPMKNGYDENKGYDESYENKCATNYSIITTQQLERHAQQAAHNAQQVHQ